MITEVALLQIIKGKELAFEAAFKIAENIINKMPGYLQHELQKCLEDEYKYLLLVRWEKLEDHTEGFRKSAEYQDWKKLLHHFYDPFPIVEHFTMI